MASSRTTIESHRSSRIGWLRAAVLGANDGILSTGSLIVGVAAAHGTQQSVVIAGVAGLAAGAMSMAAGEYVSVSSQADTEQADLALEAQELKTNYKYETKELAKIYEPRGVQPQLAMQVAQELMAHDALGAHARDELGISPTHTARPVQAALASAGSFAIGGSLPLLLVFLLPIELMIQAVSSASLIFLAVLGGMAAHAGGANVWKGAVRVALWGALAMAVTAGIGAAFSRIAT